MGFNYNTRFIFPQLSKIDSSSNSNMSIKIVLEDIKNILSLLSSDNKNISIDCSYSLIYFFNFNHFLLYLKTIVPHLREYQKMYGKPHEIIVFTVVEGTELMIDEFKTNGIIDGIEKLKQFANLKIIPVSDYTKYTIENAMNSPNILEPTLYHGIDTTVYCASKNISSNYKNTFLFLTVGTNRSRKNINLLVNTFINTFSHIDDNSVKLIVNTDHNNGLPIHPKIIYSYNLSKNNMGCLYRNCHAFITTTKCEGFGLPVLEALACGTPVISPYHTGIMSICTHNELFLIKSYIEKIKPNEYKEISLSMGSWYNVDVSSLSHNLLEVYETNPKLYMKDFIYGLANKMVDKFSIANIIGKLYNDIGMVTKYIIENQSQFNYIDFFYNDTPILKISNFYIKLFRYLETNKIGNLSIFKSTDRDISIYKKYIGLYGGSIYSDYSKTDYNYYIFDFEMTTENIKNPYKTSLDFIHLLSGIKAKNYYIQLDNVIETNGKLIGPCAHIMFIIDTLEKLYDCKCILSDGTARLYKVVSN